MFKVLRLVKTETIWRKKESLIYFHPQISLLYKKYESCLLDILLRKNVSLNINDFYYLNICRYTFDILMSSREKTPKSIENLTSAS